MALKEASKNTRAELSRALRDLGLRPYFPRSNPAMSRDTQITKCVKNKESIIRSEDSLMYLLDILKKKNEEMYYIAILLSVSGCRISEILNINGVDISPDLNIRIKSLKHSENRVISGLIIKERLQSYVGKDCKVFNGVTRFTFYNTLKGLGLFYYFNNNKKASVTHLFRHKYVKDLKKLGLTITDVQKVIGHKRLTSTEYYYEATEGNIKAN